MLDLETAKRVKDAVYMQKFHLLVGAGISLNSTNQRGHKLASPEDLRVQLCQVTEARSNSPLWRVAGYLSDEQTEQYITTPYLGCKAGLTAKSITSLIWKYIFSLNVDDALENAFEHNSNRLQTCVPVNYSKEFELFRNPQQVPIIHVHGFVREPHEKYVFSMQEYARVQRSINPWIHLLSNLILSEPFIIAGTSLFEPDIEYFIASRTHQSNVKSRAPSILVEPSPDAGTKKDCERFGLVLVESTLEEFIEWIVNKFGLCPNPSELLSPQSKPRIVGIPSKLTMAAFWTDFSFVTRPIDADQTQTPSQQASISPFLFGRQPSWDDIWRNLDVPLFAQLELIDECRRWLGSSDRQEIICLTGQAGAGKSTTLKRVAAEISERDFQVFYLKTSDGIDINAAAEYLGCVTDPILIIVDSLAEFSDEINLLLRKLSDHKRILVLSAERSYRKQNIKNVIHEINIVYFDSQKWRYEERRSLVENYINRGLVGQTNADVIKNPERYARQLENNFAAEAICRILNDFSPLARIARSLWNDSSESLRHPYLAVALANYCTPIGVRKLILTSAFDNVDFDKLVAQDLPLRIFFHADDPEFLVPASNTLSVLLVEQAATDKAQLLLDIFTRLGNALAPYVTRSTIRQHTAESKLAGRLFDADDTVIKLLGNVGQLFYEQTHELWKWNSRYWEQRALYVAHTDLDLALRYARHAVSIERHPFPMTTLAQLLFRAAHNRFAGIDTYFADAIKLMNETFQIESKWERGRTKTAFRVVMNGSLDYISCGGKLSSRQHSFLARIAADVQKEYSDYADLVAKAVELSKYLQSNNTV